MVGAMLILAGVLIGLYGLAVLLGDREPDGTVREGVAQGEHASKSHRKEVRSPTTRAGLELTTGAGGG
jgi:hypothetical protein